MKKAIVIEDNYTHARDFVRMLARLGYPADMEHSGNKGLQRLLSGKYDLALVDYKIPDLDGIEIIRRANAAKVRTAILCISGRMGVEDKNDILSAGAALYLEKTFDEESLRVHVNAAFTRLLPEDARLIRGSVVVDTVKMRATCNGLDMELAAAPFAVLLYLARNVGRHVSSEELCDALGTDSEPITANGLRIRVNAVRTSGFRCGEPELIKSKPGEGYALNC